MTATVFVDTNVLVYASDARDPAKKQRALDWLTALWRAGACRTSTQVLQEYYVTVTRKLSPALSRDQARADVDDLIAWHPVPLGESVIRLAWSIEDRFGLSWWDSLIVAAAQSSKCDVLLTEDLQAGQRFGSLAVVNPFDTEPGDYVG